MTIYQIAERLKISASTVSRALNPATRDKVAQKTLERIDGLAQRHRYTPNLAARGLRQSRYQTLGLVVPHFEGLFGHEYYTTILSGVSDAVLKSSYRFKLVMLKEGQAHWDRHNFKAGEGVDGLILVYCPNFHADKKTLGALDVPCAVINDFEEGVKAHFVCGDNHAGGALVAEYLYSKGHRHIAILKGPDASSDGLFRLKGFQSYFTRNRLKAKISILEGGNNDEPEAAAAVETHLKTGSKATALFCLNDRMAFGAIKKLDALGVRCPGKMSVMGYDDNPRAASFAPPLSTIRVPLYAMAKEAAYRLMDHLDGKNKGNFFYKKTVFPVALVPRSSVASCK